MYQEGPTNHVGYGDGDVNGYGDVNGNVNGDVNGYGDVNGNVNVNGFETGS